jgi:hypothetical protein
MKKFLTSLVLFTFFTSIIYVIGIVSFGRYVPKMARFNLPIVIGNGGYSHMRFSEAKSGKKVDILILGSSLAYRGYDPRIFKEANWEIFNLGSSSQTPVQTEYLVNKYLDRFKPKFVILDVYPVLFNSDGIESAIDLLSNSESHQDLIGLNYQNNDIRIYNTFIYQYCREFFNFDKDYKEKSRKKNSDKYIKGGFVESNAKFKPKDIYSPFTYVFLPAQKKAFSNIIDKLKNKNIAYLILQSPIPQRIYESVTNNAEADSLFSQYGPYVNANGTLKLPDSCFLDESHLNQSGVEIYNDFVIQLLKDNYYTEKPLTTSK